MIEWKEEYSTGVTKLDEQHKSLFDYSNELEGIIKDGVIFKSTLELGLRFLEMYAKGHFAHEEDCMHRYACPVAQNNKSAHQEFILKVQFFQKSMKEGSSTDVLLKEIHHFLENWLVWHICKIDTQLKPCVH